MVGPRYLHQPDVVLRSHAVDVKPPGQLAPFLPSLAVHRDTVLSEGELVLLHLPEHPVLDDLREVAATHEVVRPHQQCAQVLVPHNVVAVLKVVEALKHLRVSQHVQRGDVQLAGVNVAGAQKLPQGDNSVRGLHHRNVVGVVLGLAFQKLQELPGGHPRGHVDVGVHLVRPREVLELVPRAPLEVIQAGVDREFVPQKPQPAAGQRLHLHHLYNTHHRQQIREELLDPNEGVHQRREGLSLRRGALVGGLAVDVGHSVGEHRNEVLVLDPRLEPRLRGRGRGGRVVGPVLGVNPDVLRAEIHRDLQ
eukprot:RCo054223